MAVTFPVAAVCGGALHRVFRGPVDFVGPDGIQHPREAWTCWSDADWAAMCPDWSFVAFVDERPADTLTHRYVQRAEAEWDVSANAVTVTYEAVALTPEEVANRTRNAAIAVLARTDSKMPRPYEDLLTDIQQYEPERYDRLPQAVRDLHAERLAARAALEGV